MDSTTVEAAEAASIHTFTEAPAGWGRLFFVCVLLVALTLFLVPFWLIGFKLASDPAVRAVAAARPQTVLLLGFGLLLLIGLFGWPLFALLRGALGRRRIIVADGTVHAQGLGPFGMRGWSEPLGAYAGVAHRVRSTISGVRHELVLVHERASRSVVLVASPSISSDAAGAAARLFSLAEIPSREASRFSPLHGFFPLAEPQTPHAAAGPAFGAARL